MCILYISLLFRIKWKLFWLHLHTMAAAKVSGNGQSLLALEEPLTLASVRRSRLSNKENNGRAAAIRRKSKAISTNDSAT